MNVAPPQVLVAGDVMRDIVVRPEGPVRRGSDVNAEIRILPGGSAANQARWLAHAGVGVRLVARVGAEDVEMLSSAFRSDGVEPHLSGDPAHPTGALVNLVEPDGERSFLTDGGANRHLSVTDVEGALTGEIRMVLLSGYGFFAPEPRAAMQALIAGARAGGVPVAVDAASAGYLEDVGPERFLDWIKGTSLLLANREEALVLTGSADSDRQISDLLARFDEVVIKLGSAGAIWSGRDGATVHRPALSVEVIDTTGAGDAFAAGFFRKRLDGGAPAECLPAGHELASQAVGLVGGQPAGHGSP